MAGTACHRRQQCLAAHVQGIVCLCCVRVGVTAWGKGLMWLTITDFGMSEAGSWQLLLDIASSSSCSTPSDDSDRLPLLCVWA